MRRTALLVALATAITLLIPTHAAGATDWSWPVRGDVVTKYRNGDDPYAGGQHRGIDIAAPVGADVGAATSGRVVFAGTVGSSGLVVTLRTTDGRFDLSHLHLSTLDVREGDQVARGDRLGAVGVSGRRSTAEPHLHFGVRVAGSEHAYRDPLDFLPPPGPAVRPEAPVTAPQPAPVAAPPPVMPQPVPAPRPAGPGVLPAPAPSTGPVGATAAAAVALPVASLADGPTTGTEERHGAAAPKPAHGPAAPRRTSRAVDAAPRPERVRSSANVASPDLGAAPKPGSGAARSPVPDTPDARATTARRGAASFDTGWLVALVGLVAAATCLGHPDSARRAARRGRASVAGALRPLLGRG